jgi:hypothetical protein
MLALPPDKLLFLATLGEWRRGRYPQPGTDKWYAIGNEKPISPYESVAVLQEVESGEDCFTVHFAHSGKYVSISTMDKVCYCDRFA